MSHHNLNHQVSSRSSEIKNTVVEEYSNVRFNANSSPAYSNNNARVGLNRSNSRNIRPLSQRSSNYNFNEILNDEYSNQ